MMRNLCRIFAAISIFLVALAHGHEAHNAGTTATKSAGPILGASIAFDSHGNLWAVHFAGKNLVLSKSSDQGRHWAPPVRVLATPEAMDGGGDARPNIAIGPGDDIFITWTRPLSKPYTGEVRFVRSLDGGRTFSAPRRLHADAQEITHRFDAMTVTPDGKVLVAWIDKRDGVTAGGKGARYTGAAVYYAVSDDRGATFRGDYRAAEHSCECCRIALAPQPDGKVLALWRHVFEPNVRDHALAELGVDGNVSGFRRATFDDWLIDACPHHGPALALDGSGAAHAVWYSGTPGNEGIYYRQLTTGVMIAPRRVGGDLAEHADIASSGSQVVIAWKEFDGNKTRLRAMRSNDRGATFVEMDLANANEASDHPRLLARDGKFYVLWNTATQPLRVFQL